MLQARSRLSYETRLRESAARSARSPVCSDLVGQRPVETIVFDGFLVAIKLDGLAYFLKELNALL